MQTQAVVFTQINQVEVQTVDLPELAPNHARIRTLASGISAGTEGWVLANEFTWAPTQYPCIPGYQRVGVIEVGAGEWQAGERVFATRGNWTGRVVSFWGAHAGVGDTPVQELYRVPEAVDDINAANTVVAQVGYNAASRLVMDAGDWVLVMGDGLIGQSAAQAARARGAKVIIAGHREKRLALAAAHSADAVVNSHHDEVPDAVKRITGGVPVRLVLDSVQGETVQRQYMPLLDRGSQIVYCGFTSTPTWADMGVLQQGEVTTHFVAGWTRQRVDATLALMAEGKMNLTPLVTHAVGFDQAPRMYAMSREKAADFLGMTLLWKEIS